MHGNVWQWCEDKVDPSDRVARGGSWDFLGFHCKAAFRNAFPQTSPVVEVGFRLARVPVRAK